MKGLTLKMGIYFEASLLLFKLQPRRMQIPPKKETFPQSLSVINFKGGLWDVIIVLVFIITTRLPKSPPFCSFNFFDNGTPTLLKICYVTTLTHGVNVDPV